MPNPNSFFTNGNNTTNGHSIHNEGFNTPDAIVMLIAILIITAGFVTMVWHFCNKPSDTKNNASELNADKGVDESSLLLP